MELYVSFVIVITSSFYICLMCYTPIDYGESCGKGVNSGICKLFSECPSGINQVMQKQTHNLERCGFQNDEEILCCPDFVNKSQQQNKTSEIVVWDIHMPTKPHGSNVGRKGLAGESCGKGINSGICKLFSECPSGINQVKQKQTHNLERCGFQKNEEILCCPDFKNESRQQNKTTEAVVWDVYLPTKPRGSNVDRKILAGKPCGEVENLGICKISTECPLEWNTENKIFDNSSCGFLDDGTEMICCSDIENDTLTNNENKINDFENILKFLTAIIPIPIPRDSKGYRKSEAACKKYNRYTSVILANRIIGGSNAIIGEFPHMAQIGYQHQDFINLYNWECGGSLIHPRFVLTAAHCAERADGIPPKIVRFGFIDVYLPNGTNVIEHLVQNYTVHPNYHRISKINDIALIELSDEVLLSENVYPACLYQTNDDPSNLIITGWGVTLSGNDSRILQKAYLKPIDVKNCSTIYATKLEALSITSNQICCLIYNSMIDTCQGDSGGPLKIIISEIRNLYAIVGVTSYGVGCGDGKTPGVYTRVSSYIDWIESIVWP